MSVVVLESLFLVEFFFCNILKEVRGLHVDDLLSVGREGASPFSIGIDSWLK